MKEKVLAIIAKVLEVDISEVELDTSIGDLPEWDSIHHLLIIATLQEEFSIKYDPHDLAELEDVADLIKLTEEAID